MSDQVVELQEIAKTYALGPNYIHALKGVNLSIKKGDFLTIMGASGSGKSTLLNLIGCLDTPTKGIIKINNIDISKLDDEKLTAIRRSNIGFIFQQFNLIPTLTALENIELPMVFSKVSEVTRQKKALSLLEQVNLDSKYATHKPYELSGGQQQRVAIARALANSPSLLLADEPTGNLDTKTGREIMELLRFLNLNGTTMVVVTHDPTLMHYSNRNVKLIDGEISNENS
ncbi:Cell division transporter, ATP-binding protein FtsE [Methanosarcina barkeri str. Wiesmoor]|uniref:Cell division transporter, ATP-binding protein FtsE n=2 Tax=Methanosarcina barkeri TaxID=2208 RepID=A0A0E3QP08_METBA|nr:ABC transporter ATP-binding protein [Methanosarcina barkeri]AKB51617.1 Cell division transporter, ATP-binding protein FtsE [Methanosarcina barkeri str. Wiesmoor]